MKVFVTLACLLGAVSAHELHAKWSSFKAAHGKSYAPHEEAARLQAFSANLRTIQEHNKRFAAGEVSYELGVNEFSDLTFEELRATRFGAMIDHDARAQINATAFVSSMPSAPAAIDWRNNGGNFVTPAKNQASCGSCYTFSAAGVLESGLLMKRQGSYDLSEQQLVDCTFNKFRGNFNFGCNGGDPAQTIQWGITNGVSTEAQYPYYSGQSRTHYACRSQQGSVRIPLRMGTVGRDENQLAEALATYGPIAITLNGENSEFYNYKGGIYNNPQCSTQINHAVLLVGYGSQNGQNYWIIKNSWGTSWGENGFMKLARGYNRCGIVSWPSYYVY